MFSLVIFITFTVFSDHHHHLLSEHFQSPPEETPYALAVTPWFRLPLALSNHSSLSCLCGFSYSGHFIEMDHRLRGPHCVYLLILSMGVCVVPSFRLSVNSTGMSICVQVSVWVPVLHSLGFVPRSGIAGSCVDVLFHMLRSCCFPQ